MTQNKKLSQQELFQLFSEKYEAPAQEWICVCFLLPVDAVNWEEIKAENKFPYRHWVTVQEALKDQTSTLKAWSEDGGILRIKRDTFMEWAAVKWFHYKEVKQAIRAFKKYKKSKNGSAVGKPKIKDLFLKYVEAFFGDWDEEKPQILEKEDPEVREAFKEYIGHRMSIKSNTFRRYMSEHFVPKLKEARKKFSDSADE